jgi:hypothetical protein
MSSKKITTQAAAHANEPSSQIMGWIAKGYQTNDAGKVKTYTLALAIKHDLKVAQFEGFLTECLVLNGIDWGQDCTWDQIMEATEDFYEGLPYCAGAEQFPY